MRSFWLKIGFGALAVFALGMMVLTVGRQAKAAAAQAMAAALREGGSVTSVSDAPADIPFRIDGDRIGVVRHLAIRRIARDQLPEVNLAVQLDQAAYQGDLTDCVLVPVRRGDFGFDEGFHCAEGMTGHLVELGTASFTPGGFERPLMIAPGDANQLRHGDPVEATADLGGELRINAQGDGGELVRLLVDRHGANIRVRDELGRTILRLLADSTGASLRVRDKDGREVVRLEAGDGRLSLLVDTAGN